MPITFLETKREIISDISYRSCEEDDEPWINSHNVRKIIRSTIKNEYVGDSLYDFGTTSIDEEFWKYMMRKRKSQKTMTRMLKERLEEEIKSIKKWLKKYILHSSLSCVDDFIEVKPYKSICHVTGKNDLVVPVLVIEK